MEMKKPKRFVSENIPIDCWELILNHLNHDDLISISLVCKDFLKTSNNLVKSMQVSNPDINLLSRHLKRFRKIESICFNRFEGRIYEALEELACNLGIKNLKVLRCYLSKDVDYDLLISEDVDYDLQMVVTLFPNLEELQIRSSYRIGGYRPPPTVLSVESLSFRFKFLKKVNFFMFHYITDQSLDALTLNCALLKDVSLSFCFEVTETGIGCLLRNRPNLEALSLGWIEKASTYPAITIENSIGHAKALASLKLNHMDVSDNLLEAIANAKLPLREFELVQCDRYSVSELSKVLHASKHLRKLSISSCDADMTLLFMDEVGQNITHIDIPDCCETTVTTLFLLLTKCPSLVELKMLLNSNHPEAVNFPSSKQYHSIRTLSLRFLCKVSDAFVIQIGHSFPNLQFLELIHCQKATNTGIEAVLQCCRSITKLTLFSYGYGRRMVMEADNSQLLNLEVLELIASDVDDVGLAAVAQRCCRLVSLKLLTCKNVSTKGIKHIVKSIRTLKCLKLGNLDHQDYDDLLEWMLSTRNTASLKRIYIAGHNFKDEQRNRFVRLGCLLYSNFT